MHASWDMDGTGIIFCHFGPFLPFNPQKPRKSKFWKYRKKPWRYYPFTYVYHKWRSYEIWSAMDRIFCHLRLFFAVLPWQPTKSEFWKNEINGRGHHFTHAYHKWWSYNVLFFRGSDRMFCHFGPFFTILPPNNPENHNFEKMKKTEDVIILHMSTINYYHMMYGSWDMEDKRQKFL